jgi:hypothetical protein
MKTVIIDGVEYAQVSKAAENKDGKKYVIVRCSAAGVHSGFLESWSAETASVVLSSSRRLWRWYGHTLSGLAIDGTTDPGKCKFGAELDEIILLGACEIIPCSVAATESLRGVPGWKND